MNERGKRAFLVGAAYMLFTCILAVIAYFSFNPGLPSIMTFVGVIATLLGFGCAVLCLTYLMMGLINLTTYQRLDEGTLSSLNDRDQTVYCPYCGSASTPLDGEGHRCSQCGRYH